MKKTTSSPKQCRLPLFPMLGIMTVLAAVLSLTLGPVSIPLREIVRALTGNGSGTSAQILLLVRLPRTCGCLLAGMALAVSGAIIQTVLNNPLAAPNIIGVNAGAGLAVTLSSAFLPTYIATNQVSAFLGAFSGVLLVLLIAEKAGASRITLVLAGMTVSTIFSAGIDMAVTFFPDALNGYSDFRIGGLDNLSMEKLAPAAMIIFLMLLAAMVFSNDLSVLTLGTDMAQSLGLRVKRVRLLFLAIAAAMAGASVSFCGLLGFVGLLVPHIMRRFAGESCTRLLLASALGGAAFLTVCDLISRLIFAPYELPVGILLSLIGGPFFIWLLLRQRGGRVHD